MINHSDLFHLASSTLSSPEAISEAEIRRSVSALYYSLFHQLSSAAVAPLSHGGAKLISRAARALEHRTMLKVCKTFAEWNNRKQSGPLATLLPAKLDERLATVANTFVTLQDARLRADYDLASDFTRQDALTLLESALRARFNLAQILGDSTTTVFLTALLLGERWTRSG